MGAGKKKRPNGRDYLLLKLIAGATKAGVHVDRRKKANRNACRKSKRRDKED